MASLSVLRGMAARCVHNSPAIGGRIPHLRAKRNFSDAHVVGKMIKIICRLRAAKSVALAPVFCPFGQKMRRVVDGRGCVDF